MYIYPYTLPETNGSHLTMDGWETIFSFPFEMAFYLAGDMLSFREGFFGLVGGVTHEQCQKTSGRGKIG